MSAVAGNESLGKAFAGSLVWHGGLIAFFVASGLLNLSKTKFGNEHVSSGSVGVGIVKSIPIPRNQGPTNPLANDTKAIAPEAPTPVKLQKQVLAPQPDAIPIPNKFDKPAKLSPKQQSKAYFQPPVAYKPNQVYATTSQAMSSPLYGTQGAGGIDVGPASVLGSRYGAYVDLMRQRIAQHWSTADVHSKPTQKCAVSFTIARNGAVTNVQVTHPSGDYLLDTSAKRAVLDANPLPSLPPQYLAELGRNEATVELWFQLQQ